MRAQNTKTILLIAALFPAAFLSSPAGAEYWESSRAGSATKFRGSSPCGVAAAGGSYFNIVQPGGNWSAGPCLVRNGVAVINVIRQDMYTVAGWGGAALVCEAAKGETKFGNTCRKGQRDTEPPEKTCVTNPVDPANGRKLQLASDFESAGPNPMRVERRYTHFTDTEGRHANGGAFGLGWRGNFEYRFFTYSTKTSILLPDGRDLFFYKDSTNVWKPSWSDASSYSTRLGAPEKLVELTSEFELTDANGIRYYFAKTQSKELGPIRIVFPGGNVHTYAYRTTTTADPRVDVVASITDSAGRVLSFDYDRYTRVSAVKFNSETVLQYTYLAKGDPIPRAPFPGAPDPTAAADEAALNYTAVVNTVTDVKAGTSVTYKYDNPTFRFALTAMVDERNIEFARWQYDAEGRVTVSEHADGADRGELTYAATKTSVKNALGKIAEYNFQYSQAYGGNLLTSVVGQPSTNCPLSSSAREYDANFFVSKETDAEGRITTFVNDPVTGLPTSVTRGFGTAAANTATMTWNTALRQPTKVVEAGLTTDFVWDTAGKLTTVTQTDTTTHTAPFSTNGRKRIWAYGYDTKGQLTSIDGPLAGAGDKVSYTYNAQGFVQTITNEVGHVTTITAWNYKGQPTSVTDPNGVVTTYAYDGAGRATSVIRDPGANQRSWTMSYTPSGDLASFTPPFGGGYAFTWDNARRLSAVQNSLGERIEYTRDAMGNVLNTSVKDGAGNVHFSEARFVDELGRLIRQQPTAASVWKFAYDKTDRVATVTDPRNKVVSFGYDAVGRAISQTERDAGQVSLGYNGKDEITSYTDPKNLATTYVRNGFGEVIREASPDRGITTYDHDARGLVTTTKDARTVVTNFTYDNAGRLLTKTYPSNTALNVTYTYDSVVNGHPGKGRLTRMVDSAGTTDYTYDRRGSLTAEARTITGVTGARTVSYFVDGPGRIWGITYPSGRTVQYDYDSQGRRMYVGLVWAAAPGGQAIVNWTGYYPFGPISGLNMHNGFSRWDFVGQNYQLTGRQYYRQSDGSVFAETWPWWGNEDMNLNSIADGTNAANNLTFSYDDAGRLNGSTGPYGARSYTYDKVGNRLSEVKTPPGGTAVTQTYTYVANTNRLSSVVQGTTTLRAFGYDAAGNIISDNRAGSVYNYTISAAGRIANVMLGTTQRAAYLYDGRSRLAKSVRSNVANAGTTHYVHNADDRIIAELDSAGNTLREYIYLDDIPVAVVEGGTTLLWVHSDHLNRPVKMLDSAQNVVWEALYEPFGTVHSIVGTAANDNRFPGQLFQLETGLAYNWHRHYDSTIGRYTQVDPLGLETLLSDGGSAYGYARQSPLIYTDSTGQFAWALAGGAGRLALSAAGALATSQVVKNLLNRNQCKPDDDCQRLYSKIDELVSELKRREADLREDKLGLPQSGRMSIMGHEQQFKNKQASLRRLLAEADAKGCRSYNRDAWHWATKPRG